MRILFLVFLISFSLFAEKTQIEKDAEERRSIETNQTQAVVKKTYKDAVDSEDSSQWNTKNWQEYNKKQGVDDSLIGNSQMRIQSFIGAKESTGNNPNMMQSEYLQQNPEYKNEPSIQGWNNQLMNSIVSSTIAQEETSGMFDETTKCYITRDIPIRYKCGFTGILYGDGINNNGIKARNQCENECYEQFEAATIVEEGKIPNEFITDIVLETLDKSVEEKEQMTKEELNTFYQKFYKELKFNNALDNENVLTSISFDHIVTEEKKAYIDISYLDMNKNERTVIRGYMLQGENSNNVAINSLVTNLIIKVYTKDVDTKLELKKITLNYDGGKYICPKQQDLTDVDGGNFAYVCPSGNLVTLNFGYKSYTICSDYGVVGDNADGTFSSKDTANSICKKSHPCKMDISVMNTSVLQEFREGCIEGQSNCRVDTCKKLRLEEHPILNENVFDSGQYPLQTIVNEAQVQGVKRPRILLREDLDFQTRTAEELKDEAYLNMISNKTFAITNVNIDEDTEGSSAFNIGISETSNLYAGSAKRALYWLLKPKAYSVDRRSVKLYSIFDVIVERKELDEFGKEIKIKDRILYLKTGSGDYLKPFARKVNFARNIVTKDAEGELDYLHTETQTSSWQYQSFNINTNTWFTHSSGLTAEYFENKPLVLDNSPTFRIKLISEVNNLVYLFPGIVKSKTKNGPYEVSNYTGKFDSTGETVQKVTVYEYYTADNAPTYTDFVTMIDEKELKPIYDSLSFNSYAKQVKNDNGTVGGDFQLFLYGKKEKKTGYMRVFPKKEDVGRNGFIFIFAVGEQ